MRGMCSISTLAECMLESLIFKHCSQDRAASMFPSMQSMYIFDTKFGLGKLAMVHGESHQTGKCSHQCSRIDTFVRPLTTLDKCL